MENELDAKHIKCKSNMVYKVKIEEDGQTKEATVFANILTNLDFCKYLDKP